MRAALVFIAGTAMAASSPENVVVLVNGDSWSSTTVANAYRVARDIPSRNFIVLRDIPSFEQVSVADFREKILVPAILEAERRGLGSQLDYLLYSTDFPTAIDVGLDMEGKTFPKQITQPASINGLSYFYKLTATKNTVYLGMNANFYFRQIARSAPNEPLPDAAQARYAAALKRFQEISKEMERELEAGNAKLGAHDAVLGEIRKELEAINKEAPGRSELLYNLACVAGRQNDVSGAMAALRDAFAHGWWDIRQVQFDTDLRLIHDRPDFKELIDQAKKAKFELWPTSGFRGNVGWLPTGQPVGPNQGARYLLSTTLGHTSGRGMSVPQVVANLTQSAKADGTRPRGTVYFLENDDVRSKTREWAFVRATEKLKDVGVSASVERGILPLKKPDVIGLTAGAEQFSWSESGSTILPGAICEHLTSFGGMLREGDSQTPLVEFLRHGAAGASGTVAEPYAIQVKFPTPFIHYHYAQGCTLAEAFYQSIAGPYQLLIVGDALCAPWKKRIAVSAPDLKPGSTIRGKVQFQPAADSPDNLTISHFELHVDGRRIAIAKAGTPLVFDSTALADGAHELQLVATATDALATTGRMVIPCLIQNSTDQVSVGRLPARKISWSEPLKLKARAVGAKRIVFRQMGREVAGVDGEEGILSVDLRGLGQGTVQLDPVGIWADGREVFGEPIRFNVMSPSPLPAQETPSGKVLAKGFAVMPAGGAPVIVQKAEGNWLTQAGVKDGMKFVVEGWFSVDAVDVYQFQLRGPADLKITVDGVAQDWPCGKEWWFVPVALSKGLHVVRIEGKADGAASLDARFGGPGSYRLNGERFQHVE